MLSNITFLSLTMAALLLLTLIIPDPQILTIATDCKRTLKALMKTPIENLMNATVTALTIREIRVAVMNTIETSTEDDLIGMIADTDLIQRKKAMILVDLLVLALMTLIALLTNAVDIQEIEGIMTGNMRIVQETRSRDIQNSMITTANVPIETVIHILLVDKTATRKKTQMLISLDATQGPTNKMNLLPIPRMTSTIAAQEVIVLHLLMRMLQQVAQKSEVMSQLRAMKMSRIPNAPREPIKSSAQGTRSN